MSTVWWVTVTALAAAGGFVVGFVVRGEMVVWARGVTGETIDFTRRKIGA